MSVRAVWGRYVLESLPGVLPSFQDASSKGASNAGRTSKTSKCMNGIHGSHMKGIRPHCETGRWGRKGHPIPPLSSGARTAGEREALCTIPIELPNDHYAAPRDSGSPPDKRKTRSQRGRPLPTSIIVNGGPNVTPQSSVTPTLLLGYYTLAKTGPRGSRATRGRDPVFGNHGRDTDRSAHPQR